MHYVSIVSFVLRNWRYFLIVPILLFGLIFFFFFTFTSPQFSIDGVPKVSAEVERYEDLITKYAKKYGVEQHVNVLMAKMMQESGGRGGDPMQSSESLGLPPNTITNPEKSIRVGIKYFAQVLEQADGDIPLALQSYNFGGGFIPYANERGGYSKEVARDFSVLMAARLGWDSYGDINYVDNVLRYLEGNENVGYVDASPNMEGWLDPIRTYVTSVFGYRTHPITGISELHGGVDFGCNQSNPPIYAAADGKVTRAGWQNPANPREGFGQRVYVDHGNGLTTVYAHMSLISVRAGQTVKQGQQLGLCGTTGSSTANHLHLELHQNGKKIDPYIMGFY